MAQPGKVSSEAANGHRPWVILRSFAGWRPRDLGPDTVAGLTLAAIAIPEQMATARLAGLPPRIGFFALIAGAVGFALFGASRRRKSAQWSNPRRPTAGGSRRGGQTRSRRR